MSDPRLRRQVERLAAELTRTQQEVQTLRRAARRPQLGDSSIDSGALEVRDPDTGATRLRIGYQPDGSVGIIPDGGDPPPAPSVPVVASAPVGLMVQWDGRLAHDLTLPADFDHVSVHVSGQADFTPDASTFQGTIPRAGGLFPVVPLEPGETYYVQLVGVGTGGVEGAPSEEASGVPDSVGGVPGPGSITETEIADDAVTSPKIRALAVEAYHIVAEAIEAGHIQAGAVEASKLAAEIVLASRLIAGDPEAARVEIGTFGLRGYNSAGQLVFAVEDGDAAFSGDITGSRIFGSRFTLGTAPGPTGVIEGDSAAVVQRVQVGETRAQIAANSTSGQANFLAASDVSNPSAPLAGFAAQGGTVLFALDSSALPADRMPAVTGQATSNYARLDLWSQRNSLDGPYASLAADPTRAAGTWGTASGSQVRIDAVEDWVGISALPEPSTVGQPGSTPGTIYGFRRSGTDAPTLSVQSPMSTSGPGADRRAYLHVEGANTNRAHTVMNSAARLHIIQGELVDGSTDRTTDGCVQLADTHSISASRHAPVRTDMVTAPSGTFSGTWTAFSNAAYPSIAFKTGWSGRVRIVITAAAGNTNTPNATVHFGFGLTGASTIGPAVSRAWNARSTAMQCSSRVLYMDLIANADYTLTPHYNISSGSTTGSNPTVVIQDTYEHSIVVEPLT